MTRLGRRTGAAAFWLVLLLASPRCARRDATPSSATRVTSTGTVTDPTQPRAQVERTSEGSQSNQEALQERSRAQTERRNEREHLVRALARDGIDDARVLDALRRVPRHRFVPQATRGEAYADRPLPIGWGQTISQPYIVALMTRSVRPKPSERCLEIGTGSGYQAAVLAELCGSTYSIEYLPEVAAFGKANLRALGYSVELRTGDGYQGWPDAAPFDVILVTAAPEKVPDPLLAQLAVGGRLAIPVGPEREVQKLETWTRLRPGRDREAFERRTLADVRFVPFLGHGDR